jgi:phenylacetaldehyde dehydrogenase
MNISATTPTLSHLSPATRDVLTGGFANFIDGSFRPAKSGATLAAYDPSSGSIVATAPASGSEDIDDAVAAARRAFSGPWSKLRPAQRERLLLKLADALEADGEVLAQLETLNNGQSFGVAKMVGVGASAEHLRYMAGWATKIEGSTLDVSIPIPSPNGYRAMTLKQPVGVVGAIIPWNFPLLMAVWKIAPALAAGCTVVMKPAEETPLTALRLAKLIQDVGFPDGVVNVVSGYGHEAGAALAAHPGIDKIAFTGSTEVGKKIGRAAVENMTRVSLELGGKSPMVMFPDMTLQLTGFAAQVGLFFNQGQVCTCGSRLIVHRSIFDRVVADFVAIAQGFKLGSGFDQSAQLNPLVSAAQQQRVLRLVDQTVSAGAKLATGGSAPDRPGFFVDPTVLVNVDPRSPGAQEEFFGPVVVALPFDTYEEAIALANDSVYGLSASVWSNDLTTVMRFAADVQAGTVWINTHNVVDPNLPFGGYKQSGIGREHGRAGVDSYLETKAVCFAL